MLFWTNPLDVPWEVRFMSKIPSIIPVSDPRQDSARVLKEARATKEPVFITQRGRATAVLMSVEAYQAAESERELLLLLARGEKEIASGVGHSLESVLGEADELLADAGAWTSSSRLSQTSLNLLQGQPPATIDSSPAEQAP